MNILHAVVRGALQGFAKVLPISSSPFVWHRVVAGGVVIAAIMSGFKG